MFKTPYEATACRQYNTAPIVRGLKEELIEGRLEPVTFLGGELVKDLYQVNPHSHSISPFTQTISFEHGGRQVFVVDMRAFMTKKADVHGNYAVYSDIEYHFAKINAILTQRWQEGFVRDQSIFGDIAGKTFVRLLTESIVRRLAVGPAEQMQVAVVSAFYYLCQFQTTETLDEEVRIPLYGRVTRLTGVPTEQVIEILEPLSMIQNLDQYCEGLRLASKSERFQVINPATVFTSVGGVWFGANSREYVALALEYPPTFNALVFCALTYRGYQTATLSRLVHTLDRNAAGKDFTRSLTAYLKD